MDGRPSSAYMASNTGDRSASASSARYLIVRSGWSSGMRVSTSTNASMLACGSCRPRITTTSVRDGSTLSGQPLRPEEPETPKMSLFQSPASLVPGEILALWYANQLTAVDAGDLHQFGAAHRKWNLYNSHGVVSCGPIASDKQIHRKLTSLLQRQE